MRIVLDAMGTDDYPVPDVAGAVEAARTYACSIVLTGDEKLLAAELNKHDNAGLDIEIVPSNVLVTMEDKPQEVVRKKAGSSIHVGMELVQNGEADGFVSCGNTGAIHAIGTLGKIRRIRGVYRPALTSIVPVRGKPFILVDVGANVDCKPEWLVQFAIMGSIYAERVLKLPNPRVALLSNGEEETKGYSLTHETTPLLREAGLNFIGNVEPKDSTTGATDVLVCDGFVGNIYAKSLEAMAITLFDAMRDEVANNMRAKIGGALMRPALRRVYSQHDPFEIGGAPLLGLNGIVIVGHGRSNALAVKNAIRQATEAAENGIVDAIGEGINARS
jgi:phosphate acyltransferase